MRQQENKKENFRENSTKLTWIPKVYNYAERTGNLKAEAGGVVSGEKHFPVFEDRMVFKPLTKSKPFSTPLFACAEVFWSWVPQRAQSRHHTYCLGAWRSSVSAPNREFGLQDVYKRQPDSCWQTWQTSHYRLLQGDRCSDGCSREAPDR